LSSPLPPAGDPFEPKPNPRTTLRMFVTRPLPPPEDPETDRTLFLSVSDLMQRGSAEQARSDERAAPAAVAENQRPETSAERRHSLPRRLVNSLVAASLARKLTLAVLPLLITLLVLKPVFRRPAEAAKQARTAASSASPSSSATSAAPSSSATATAAAAQRRSAVANPGISLERSAADSLAAGDFDLALQHYRALAEQSPNSAAYRSAVKVLERRQGMRAP
jgi:hypothetical protein